MLLVFFLSMNQHQAIASFGGAAIPPVWDIVADNFEGGSLAGWNPNPAGNVRLAPGGGHNGSTGLAVTVGPQSSQVSKSHLAKAQEGYLTFWFNPNHVVIPPNPSWVPGGSLRIAILSGPSWWPPLVTLYVRRPAGQQLSQRRRLSAERDALHLYLQKRPGNSEENRYRAERGYRCSRRCHTVRAPV